MLQKVQKVPKFFDLGNDLGKFEKAMSQAYVAMFLLSDIGWKASPDQMSLALFKLISLPNTAAELVSISRHSRVVTKVTQERFEQVMNLKGFYQLKLTLAITGQEQSWVLLSKGEGGLRFWARTAPTFAPGQTNFAVKREGTVRIITGLSETDACRRAFGSAIPAGVDSIAPIPLELTVAEAIELLGWK